MPRTHKPTGRKPGGQPGNTNALRHGYYAALERAEKLRADSAYRSARAFDEAMKLGARLDESEQREKEEKKQEEARDDEFFMFFERIKDRPNFRGFLVELMRERVAFSWIACHPEVEAPDWVYQWLDHQPNYNQAPVFGDDDDMAPGVTDGETGEGASPTIFSETTLPRARSRTERFYWAARHPNVYSDDLAETFFRYCPQLGAVTIAARLLNWSIMRRAREEADQSAKAAPD